MPELKTPPNESTFIAQVRDEASRIVNVAEREIREFVTGLDVVRDITAVLCRIATARIFFTEFVAQGGAAGGQPMFPTLDFQFPTGRVNLASNGVPNLTPGRYRLLVIATPIADSVRGAR